MKELSPYRIRRMTEPEDLEPEYIYTSDTSEVQLSDYWKILVKRRRLIILLFVLVFGVGAYFSLSATTLYTATAKVKIDPQNPQVTGVAALEAFVGGGERYDYYQTQYALLGSRSLAAKVVHELKLESNEAFKSVDIVEINPVKRVTAWIMVPVNILARYLTPLFKTENMPSFDPIEVQPEATPDEVRFKVNPRVISQYQELYEVDQVGKTRLVSVEFSTPYPALSQALANAHVRAFLRMSLDTRFSLTEEARGFLDQKKMELREKLERSEEALNKFRRAHGVVSVEKGENIVVDRMVEVNRQLTAARAQRIEAESLYRTVENRNNQDLAEVMKQGLVQQLKSNVVNLEAEKARLSTIFKPEHPRIQELGKHISEARQALNNEIANVVRGIKSSYAAALAKERALEAEAERQQQNALQLKELGVDYTVLQEEVNANRSLYENVLKRLSETIISNDIALSNMQIVEHAEKPRRPSGPNISMYLMAYGVLGGMFSVGLALLLEFFDSTVSTPDDVWRAAGLSTLGVVPHLKFLARERYSKSQLGNGQPPAENSHDGTPSQQAAKELIISQRPVSIVSESYRNIRTSFLLSQAEKPPQVVVLTSPSPGEGKTVTTLNLSIALAQDGYSVLVIDGDLRKGCCHARLGLQNNSGLSNVLTGNLTLEDGVKQTSVKGLSLMSRGVLPPNPAELLGSRKMKEVLHELRPSFDFILIDAPPVVAVSDAAVLSVISDGVLLILDGQKTSTALTRKAVERLEMVRARMLGVILNGVNLDNPDYSYYRTYSSYYDSSDEEERAQEGTEGLSDNGFRRKTVDEFYINENLKHESPRNVDAESSRRKKGEDSRSDQPESNDHSVDGTKVGLERNTEPKKRKDDIDETYASQSEGIEETFTGAKVESKAEEILPSYCIERISQVLLEAVGPIAPLIVQDRIAILGQSRDAFPKQRLRALLDEISQEIPNQQLRDRFKKKMLEEIAGDNNP